MKKVLALMGSPRKGESFKLTQTLEQKLKELGHVEFEYLFLKDVELKMCKGCLACLSKGEEFCPSKDDDRDKILNKMLEADGIIFVTPNYSLQVSAYLKNLFDRLAYIFHRPCFFNKTSTVIVTQGVYGGDKIKKYINEVAGFWGFKVVDGAVLTTPPGVRLPEEQKKMDGKIAKVAEKFYLELTNGINPTPTLKELAMFRMVRTIKPYIVDTMPRDYEYFKEKGWMESDYFYETKLGILKRLIGKLVDRQAINMGRNIVKKAEIYKNSLKEQAN